MAADFLKENAAGGQEKAESAGVQLGGHVPSALRTPAHESERTPQLARGPAGAQGAGLVTAIDALLCELDDRMRALFRREVADERDMTSVALVTLDADAGPLVAPGEWSCPPSGTDRLIFGLVPRHVAERLLTPSGGAHDAMAYPNCTLVVAFVREGVGGRYARAVAREELGGGGT